MRIGSEGRIMILAFSIIISIAATILFAATIYGALNRHRGAGPLVALMLVLLILVGLTS